MEEGRLKHRSRELEAVLASERKRAAEAEHRAKAMDARIEDLSRRINAARIETEQLVATATLLLSGNGAGARSSLRSLEGRRVAA